MSNPLANPVRISSNKGWLRLTWSYKRKRYFLSVGLQDSPANQVFASQIANTIYLDILSNQFDKTLRKYRGEQESDITILEICNLYKTDKRDKFGKSWEKLCTEVIKHVENKIPRKRAESFTPKMAQRFIDSLGLKRTSPKRYGSFLRASFTYAMEQGLINVEDNPFAELDYRGESAEEPTPFSAEEVTKILAYLYRNKAHYAPLFEFLFLSGCRLGEALAIEKTAFDPDKKTLTIAQSVDTWGNITPGGKTGKGRVILCNERLYNLVAKQVQVRPEKALLFTAVRGGRVHRSGLKRTAWLPIFRDTDIPYRKLYSTRSTFVSLAFESGMPITQIAKITGHSKRTLIQHYLSSSEGNPVVPELF